MPFLRELYDEFTHAETRAVLGYEAHEILPKQQRVAELQEQCRIATEKWHGKPNYAGEPSLHGATPHHTLSRPCPQLHRRSAARTISSTLCSYAHYPIAFCCALAPTCHSLHRVWQFCMSS